MCIYVPGEPPGWKEALFWAGVLNVDPGTTLPFLGAAAELEYVFAAGDVWTLGAVGSTASLQNRYTRQMKTHSVWQYKNT